MTDRRAPDPDYAEENEKKFSRSQRAIQLLKLLTRDLGWPYRLYIPAVIALSAAFLLPPRFLQYFTESADGLNEMSASQFLTTLSVFGVLVAAALWLSTFLGGLLREWLRLRVSVDLRRRSLAAMHGTPLTVFDHAHRGDWMTRVTSDLHNVEEFLSDSLPFQIQSLTLVLGSAVLFLAHSGPLALIPCGAAIVLAFLNLRVQRTMAPVLTEARELEGEVFQDLIENYEGLRTIRSAGAESTVMTRFTNRLESVRRAGMRVIRSMAGLMGINELASQLVVTAILTILAYSLKQGSLTVTDVLVYPFFINVFLGNARSLAASAYEWNRFFVEGGRLAELLEHAQPKSDHHETAFKPESVKTITAEEIAIGFRGAPLLVENLDLTLQRGQIVALTGPSGCGKSTLLESLAGLRPPQWGRFRIDRGEPLDELPTEIAAYVEQRPYLFVGSIRENLCLGLQATERPDDEILYLALEELGLADLVMKRGGLDAVLTDRGLNFSEGQRYRFALSRAVLSKRPFLLLDEPFAALDEASLELVASSLSRIAADGRGIVMATHQLPGALEFDAVISLDQMNEEQVEDFPQMALG
ncbi:MAG: ABC transporter ATP-binding protein [Verrucomicrobiae bacterium]|nr:ABC transporter ATP-binding protein [Verrucomicrobiae bacterium]